MKQDYIDHFLHALSQQPNKSLALREFCRQYHYFSVNQILAFSKITRQFRELDLESVCEIAKTIYEEYGSGQPQRIHSVLFEKMALACGVHKEELPLPPENVLPGIKGYLHELNAAFAEGSLAQSLGAYVYLEKTAVTMYPRFLSSLRTMGFSDNDLEFFTVHAHLEPMHLEAAHALVKHQAFTQDEISVYEKQLLKLDTQYQKFWAELCGTLAHVPQPAN